MTRVCQLPGCDEPARKKFCCDEHRVANWRLEHFAKPVEHPRAGKNARSGSQVSYVKAVELLAAWIRMDPEHDPRVARRTAELVLRGALSERQAARERARS